jgi:hypothetical protein
MRREHLLGAVGAILFVGLPLIAQEGPGTIGVLEFQKPKNGMLQQYEAGRKQKAAWHKQQNDPVPLFVWEVLSGDDTGTYIVGVLGQHWADFDKPSVPQETDEAEYQKVVAGYVDSRITHYYEFLPKVSNPGNEKIPSKFAEVISFDVKYGKTGEFRSAMSRVHDAVEKTKWPLHFEWYALASGGSTGTFVLVRPHNNWADFADDPNAKPFREMLKEGIGEGEADSIIHRIEDSVERETSQIIQFHPELSYLPGH